MNSPPHFDQSLPLAMDLLHHASQIGPADADDPIKPSPVYPFQDDLRFATLAEHVHVRRVVIVRKNHEPEAMGTVDWHHQPNPSALGFQGLHCSNRVVEIR